MRPQSEPRHAVLTSPLERPGDGAAPVVVIVGEGPLKDRSGPPGDLSHLRQLASMMDSAFQIPGTSIRFGIDSLAGLIPGIGDSASALLAVYILHEARRRGVSRVTLSRMAANVAIDALVGSVPVAGDVFDVYWKANQRNVDLLDRHVATGGVQSRHSRVSDGLFFGMILFLAACAVVGGLVITFFLGRWLFGLVSALFAGM